MVYKERDDTDKTIAIARELYRYLPDDISKDVEDIVKNKPHRARVLDISYIVELALSHTGAMTLINGRGYDFIRVIDGVETRPESKTSSLLPKPRSSGNYGGVIRNVTRENGHQKEGDILAIIYIPYNDSVKFFYIPKAWWVNHVTANGWISYTYNTKTDSIPTFKNFECETFEDLCSPDRDGEWEQMEAEIEVYLQENKKKKATKPILKEVA
jgi:hypothetical protein